MAVAGIARRLLETVTAKAGGPIEPSSVPAAMARSPAGAGATTRRTGAAVGTGRPAWRSR
ncbi:MAG: hypothetical protein BGN94_01740 [Rhizobiales bacterium 68-8]|nr:MAG: hypothetical protein BGN94_01740 [Rhizobiales bacterium 68-8]